MGKITLIYNKDMELVAAADNKEAIKIYQKCKGKNNLIFRKINIEHDDVYEYSELFLSVNNVRTQNGPKVVTIKVALTVTDENEFAERVHDMLSELLWYLDNIYSDMFKDKIRDRLINLGVDYLADYKEDHYTILCDENIASPIILDEFKMLCDMGFFEEV